MAGPPTRARPPRGDNGGRMMPIVVRLRSSAPAAAGRWRRRPGRLPRWSGRSRPSGPWCL